MIADFLSDHAGPKTPKGEPKENIYPQVACVAGRPTEAEIFYCGLKIGHLKQNQWELWPVETGVGMRYYSNPLCAAYDYYLSKHITEADAAWVCPPPKASGYVRRLVKAR